MYISNHDALRVAYALHVHGLTPFLRGAVAELTKVVRSPTRNFAGLLYSAGEVVA